MVSDVCLDCGEVLESCGCHKTLAWMRRHGVREI